MSVPQGSQLYSHYQVNPPQLQLTAAPSDTIRQDIGALKVGASTIQNGNLNTQLMGYYGPGRSSGQLQTTSGTSFSVASAVLQSIISQQNAANMTQLKHPTVSYPSATTLPTQITWSVNNTVPPIQQEINTAPVSYQNSAFTPVIPNYTKLVTPNTTNQSGALSSLSVSGLPSSNITPVNNQMGVFAPTNQQFQSGSHTNATLNALKKLHSSSTLTQTPTSSASTEGQIGQQYSTPQQRTSLSSLSNSPSGFGVGSSPIQSAGVSPAHSNFASPASKTNSPQAQQSSPSTLRDQCKFYVQHESKQ